ncbi:MAG: ABC transporter ATP-binding protein/permease [Spirochaetales bacterium]|nr:ABC transporter ATP-binding protein/permease [Spirochaetales bacterium]
MRRLARYVKPYLPSLLFAIALLFVQANADLALPDYMSRIVNTGIQQGGVEDAVPEAVREGRLDELLLFMTASEADQVLAAYTLIDESSSERDSHIDRYPALENESIFVRTVDDTDEIDALNPIMAKAFLAAVGIPSVSISPEMLTQSAAGAVKAEYEALGMDSARIQSRYILSTGGVMLLLTLLAAVATIIVGFLSARIAAGLSRDLRLAVFERVESFSSSEIDRFSTASLITRSTNDIMQIQLVTVMLIRMVFYAPIIGVGGVIRAIGKSSSMWWVIAVAVGALSILVLVVYKVAVPRFKLMQKLMDKLNLVSRESLSGMMVIRAFSMQHHEERRFDKVNTDLTDTTLFVNRVMVVMMPVMMLIMNGLSLLVIWVGAQQVAASAMQVGDMMAFLQYTMQIVFAFLMLSMMFIMLPRAAVSAERVAEVLETQPTIKDPGTPLNYGTEFDGSIEFRNVSFRYPSAEEDVLHDISFTAKPGQTTAFIGATGAGKSTIVNLIPRFYDVTEGAILIDGKDVRAVSQHDLRERIGYVPQKPTLFSGTIESNLRYADEDAPDEKVAASVRIAQAREFINERPDGLQAEMAQAGANVSGGQKQRLSIARALVKRPPIYLFDDTFSALDFKTDAALRRALSDEAGTSTRLIVTQRIATIKTADQIIVLDDGRIVGKGTHRELMTGCETYREIALSQLTEEELA